MARTLERDRGLPALVNHRAGCGPSPGVPAAPRSRRGRWRAVALLLVHVAIGLHIWHWLAKGRSLAPLEPSEAGRVWTEGAINAGLILLVLATLSTLVLGRWFCGWACHVVALQDASAWLLRRMGLRPSPVRSRLLVLVPFLAAFEIFLAPGLLLLLEGRPLPELSLVLTTDNLWERFPGPGMAILTFVVVGFAAVWMLGAKGFCTYGCPYGAIFGVADRWAPGRIRVNDACEGCGHCTAVCTSNVLVHKEVRQHGMVVDPGCMKCLDCVSACPKDALSFAFGPVPTRAQRPTRHYDFRWGEEIAMALVFAGSLYAFRGLYGTVPFLLAVTLAVLVALLSVAVWRLWTRADFSFQRISLRQNRRWTRAGASFAAAAPLVFAFTVHSGLVQFHVRSAASLAGGASPDPKTAAWHLERAARLGLLAGPELSRRAAELHLRAGDSARAVALLAPLAAARPHEAALHLELSRALLAGGAWTEAADSYWRALDAEERLGRAIGQEVVIQRALEVAELVRRAPDEPAPAVLFARLQAAAGDSETARANLERLVERFPLDARAQALLRKLGSSQTRETLAPK